MKRIVVKVGTNVLANGDGTLDKLIFREIVVQLVKLRRDGFSPILVSSGAVGAGKSILRNCNIDDEAIRRQVFSAVGQTTLMKRYFELFIEYDIICAQVLASKDDFSEGDHYNNMANCFEGLLGEEIVPIVNENDVVALTELMFTDNDELAGLTARMVGAEKLVILSNVDGIYGNDNQVIRQVAFGDHKIKDHISSEKSAMGRGGMFSKFEIASLCASQGIETFIANGKRSNVVVDIIAGKEMGTRFLVKQKK